MTIEEQQFAEWLKGRPKIIQEIGAKLPPYKLYRLKTTGSIVLLRAYNEDGTVTVYIGPEHNEFVLVPRNVFGIKPEDLEVYEPPSTPPSR